MVKKKRIYQILRDAGLVRTKTEAVDFARQGKITVDGEVVESLHFQINPKKKELKVNGVLVVPQDEKLYIIYNKPAGVLSTKQDILPRIKELLKISEEQLNTLAPIGRLDKDTTGLLLLTSDGEFGPKILDPKHHVPKTYVARIEKEIKEEELEPLRKGVEIELEENGVITKYQTKPAEVKLLAPNKLEIILHEGKKRQVKRMLSAIGHTVISLQRVAVGSIVLGQLALGKVAVVEKDVFMKATFK